MTQTKNTNDKGTLANSFKAFESLVTSVKMFWHMSIIVLFVLFVVQCCVVLLIYKIDNRVFTRSLSQKDICIAKIYAGMYLRDYINIKGDDYEIIYTCEGSTLKTSRSKFRKHFNETFKKHVVPTLRGNILSVFLPTSLIYLLYFWLIKKFNRRHIEKTGDKFIRGKVFVPQEQMPLVLQKYVGKTYLFKLNPYVSIPESVVTRHNFVIGKPGSGKSQFIFKIVEQLIERNIKCIIHDFKGDFIPAFYDENKHYIFNPVDSRHMGLNLSVNPSEKEYESKLKNRKISEDNTDEAEKGWTIFNELHSYIDLDAFVTSMIPDAQSSEAFWYTAPRDILKAILIYCIKNGLTKNEDVCNLIETDSEKLKELFSKTHGCEVGSKHLADGKLAGQLMSVLSTYTSSLMYLKGTDGTFSINKWVSDPNPKKRVIFVANQAKVQNTLKTLISTFFDFSTKALCSLPDDMDRRLYFIMDEFGQLSKIGSVVQLLTQSRSKGGASFLLIQDQAQIEAIYGHELVKSIVNSCGNKFYFAVGDESTAEFISKELGSTEIERTKESKSFGVSDLKDSISLNADILERRIALPSEIMTQKTLRFYTQLTDLPLTQVDIEYKAPAFNCNGFVERDFQIKRTAEDDKMAAQAQKEKQEKERRDGTEEFLNSLAESDTFTNAYEAAQFTAPDGYAEDMAELDLNSETNSDAVQGSAESVFASFNEDSNY